MNELDDILEEVPEVLALMEENTLLTEKIASLAKTDKEKEILSLMDEVQLEKERANGYQKRIRELQEKLSRAASFYKTLAEITGAYSPKDLIASVKALKGAK